MGVESAALLLCIVSLLLLLLWNHKSGDFDPTNFRFFRPCARIHFSNSMCCLRRSNCLSELKLTPGACSYHQQGLAYVGSAPLGVAKHELNRASKHGQLITRNKAVHVELVLRYWSSRSGFGRSKNHHSSAWGPSKIWERLDSTRLNHPFILQHLQLKFEGWRLQFKANERCPPNTLIRVMLGKSCAISAFRPSKVLKLAN